MTVKELYKVTKRQGNLDVSDFMKLEESRKLSMTVEQARRAPLDKVRMMFELSKLDESLPEHASFKPYRIGWRGAYTISHGTASGYSQGCRCQRCKEASTQYHRDRRQRVRTANAAEQLKKFTAGTESAIAGEIPAIIAQDRAEQAQHKQLSPQEEESDRWTGMNKFLASYPADKIIPQKTLDFWYGVCGITGVSSKVEWLLQAEVEIRDENYYRKAIK